MASTDLLGALWTSLQTNLIADLKADVYPDADAVLALVANGGVISLLDPANQLTVQSFLLKLQADALKVGNDLSKQEAAFLRSWFAAKFAPPAAS